MDAGDFGAFYRATWPDVVGFCAAMVGSEAMGEELAQEAFVRLCARYRLTREPRPYVFRIARNLATQHRRHAARVLLTDRPMPEDRSVGPDGGVLDAVRRLPERLSVVVLLHYYADLPVDEVARSLRRPVGSVKRQLNEARTLLATHLGDDRA